MVADRRVCGKTVAPDRPRGGSHLDIASPFAARALSLPKGPKRIIWFSETDIQVGRLVIANQRGAPQGGEGLDAEFGEKFLIFISSARLIGSSVRPNTPTPTLPRQGLR